jgi:hypothetical protein
LAASSSIYIYIYIDHFENKLIGGNVVAKHGSVTLKRSRGITFGTRSSRPLPREHKEYLYYKYA